MLQLFFQLTPGLRFFRKLPFLLHDDFYFSLKARPA